MSKSAQSCLAAAFGPLIIVNKEALSAKSSGFDWRFSVRSFKSRGPRIEPCGTLYSPQKIQIALGSEIIRVTRIIVEAGKFSNEK